MIPTDININELIKSDHDEISRNFKQAGDESQSIRLSYIRKYGAMASQDGQTNKNDDEDYQDH